MLRKTPSIGTRCLGIGLAFTAMLWHAHAQSERRVASEGSIRRMESGEYAPDGKRRHTFIARAALKPEEDEEEILFEAALKMRNLPELQERLGKGERISHQEMSDKYFPSQADTQAVADWLVSQGYTIVSQNDTHMAVFARGKVRQIQQGMQMTFARVTSEGQEYTSAITPPSLPEKLAPLLVGINGMQPHLQARKHAQLQKKLEPNSLTGPNPPYLPSQIAKAYGVDGLYSTGVTGEGQSIAIVIDKFPSSSDLTSYWTTSGVAQSINNISFIQVVSGSAPGAPSGEETLDVEWCSSIAPNAKVRVYATTNLTFVNIDAGYQQVYIDAVTHPEYGIHQMSMSYGAGELYISRSQAETDAQYFAALASAGVTIFASSGDGGYNPSSTTGKPGGSITAESPASDPSVTGVGGTSLTLDSSGSVTAESAWSASGGGNSIYFSRPAWQRGSGLATGTMRAVPDVSAPGDPNTGGFVILNGLQYQYGGTSWSSPVWAGFCALINQARSKVNLPPLGLLGPQLYPLLGTASFRDITSGNNGYAAGAGYDLVTGIGVPNMQTFTQAMLGLQTLPAVQTVVPGTTVQFTVADTQTPDSYRWQRMPLGSSTWSDVTDNGTYGGSTTATLTVNGVTSTMSGDQFQCTVTSSGSDTTSAPSSVLIVAPPLTVATLAGNPGVSGSANGTGTAALFSYPSGIALDSSGNLYIADYGSHTIRKVTLQGVVTTPYGRAGVSGSANTSGTNAVLFKNPNGIAADTSDNLYVADTGNSIIRKITSAGVVSTLAGRAGRSGSTNGIVTSARFNLPQGVAVDSSGNVYVADSGNHLIRKITTSGTVSTLAGKAGAPGYIDATGTAAMFNNPTSLTVDGSGNVYVADLNNSVIRKITPAGVVTTPFGAIGSAGNNDGIGSSARFNAPIGVAMDSANNLYITDSQTPPTTTSPVAGNNLLRKATPAGVVSTLAGALGISGSADGTGNAAQFYSLQAVAINNRTGGVYLADTFNQTIREAGTPPVILTSPTNQSILGGQTATFNVGASGIPTPTCQWQFQPLGSSTWTALSDGGGYSGSATSTLTATGTPQMSGNLQCVVSNPFGSVTSGTATFAVAPLSIDTQPTAQTGTSGQSVTFTLSVSGAGPFSYQWTKDGVNLSGATNATLTLSSLTAADAGSYSVIVTNAYGSVTAAAFSLTVSTPVPATPPWAWLVLPVALMWLAGGFLRKERR